MNLQVLFYKALNKLCDADITQALYLDTRIFVPPPAIPAVKCQMLDANTVQSMVDQSDAPVDKTFADDFRQYQFIGVGAYVQDELAGLSFYAAGKVDSRHNSGGAQFNGIGLEMPQGVRYQFKVSVMPAHRGKRLNAAMNACVIAHWGKENVDTLVTTTDWTNQSFLKSAERQGFVRYGSAAEFVFAGKHFYWLPGSPWLGRKPLQGKIAASEGSVRFVKGSV